MCVLCITDTHIYEYKCVQIYMYTYNQIIFVVLSTAELGHSSVFVTFHAYSTIILIPFITRGLSFYISLNTDSIRQAEDASK